MLIASCEIKLYLPGAANLKDKRRIIKSLLQKSKNKFNLSAAEVDAQDYIQTAVLGVALVGSDYQYLQSVMDKYLDFVESFPEFLLTDFEVTIS
ncbi:DUF503 domain-containing protein [Halanaerobium kushneri]|jgi:hypothetical protein|uniref:DUF503 domain-containing protein n=1 Tax=Halanaerobium kushneri TaxID=56779 RepID=A0A1N6U6N5_9FIRM|nr:DUF503 domain-containing protein [Halanaerobium kushneri]SIQ60966.1 hypothetical protein SAMN05421834_10650 [Halanaerobium kushneri]